MKSALNYCFDRINILKAEAGITFNGDTALMLTVAHKEDSYNYRTIKMLNEISCERINQESETVLMKNHFKVL